MEKERWCFAFKKDQPCLKINTTSRIESINAIIKSELNSSTCLIQLFYRVLQMSNHRLNSSYPDGNAYCGPLIESLSQNLIMVSLQESLSMYAFGQVATNLKEAFNHEVKLYRGILTIKVSDEYQIQVKKKSLLKCNCKYFLTIGLLCSHLLAVALKHKETIPGLIKSVRKRWLSENKSYEHSDSHVVEFCKSFLENQKGKFEFNAKILILDILENERRGLQNEEIKQGKFFYYFNDYF